MKKLMCLLLSSVCVFLLAGCHGGAQPDAFITFHDAGNNITVKLGWSRDDLYRAITATYGFQAPEMNAGLRFKFEDKKNQLNCICMQNVGHGFSTIAGISLYNSMADILPAYQKDPDVQILQNDSDKILLGKQIDGVNYAIAFRFYTDGTIKAITMYNSDLYTDNDADYNGPYI